MPKKNIKGGKKHKKTKRNPNDNFEKNMIYKENSLEEYALVTDLVGNGNVRIKLPNGSVMIARIPGSFKKKKIFINRGNILLVSIREYEDSKSDIIYRYSDGQSKVLHKNKQLPSSFMNYNVINQNDDNDDTFIEFKDENEDDEDITKTAKPMPIDRSKRMGELSHDIPNEADYAFDLEEI